MDTPDYLATLGKDSKISLGDVVRALEMLGRRHRLFTDRVEVEVNAKVLIGVDLDRL